jgi:hypothetical protein
VDKVIAIGCSHAHWGVYGLDQYIMIHLGPRTAYNIQNHDDQVQEELNKHPKDLPVVFFLGEVDCRVHVFKQALETKRSANDVIFEIVNRYTNYIYVLWKSRPNYVYIMNVEPAADIDDPKYSINHGYTWEELNRITLEFNRQLKEACEARGITFLDIYDQMLEPGGNGRRRESWVRICTSFGRDPAHLDSHVGTAIYEKYFAKK